MTLEPLAQRLPGTKEDQKYYAVIRVAAGEKESEIQPLARQRLLDLVESLLERDQPALASGLVKNVLARHAEENDAFDLGIGDVERLKQFAANADRRFVAPRD